MTGRFSVAHGTAEALARINHFRGLTDALPEAHELDAVARLLVGHVDDHAETLDQVRDELDQLWSLLTDDWDDDDLDELTEAEWCRHSFPTADAETLHRHGMTVARLVGQIEGHIGLARMVHAERGRGVAA